MAKPIKGKWKHAVTLEIEKVTGAFPMVGWHDPWAEVTSDDGNEEYELQIGGGCRSICVSKKGEPTTFYKVDVMEIVKHIVKAIKDDTK